MSNRSRSSRRSRTFRWLRWTLLAALLVYLVLFRLSDEIGREAGPGDRFVVVRVLDGDTFELRGGDRLRLLGIDTPEKGEVYHDRAAQLLADLTLGREVRIQYAGARRDRYGRLLGYVFIDTFFVNGVLVDSGFAYLYQFKDQQDGDTLIAALLGRQRSALERGAGMWALERVQEPFYVTPPGSFRFHRPSCRNIRDASDPRLRRFSTREEALYEGLSPCRNCGP